MIIKCKMCGGDLEFQEGMSVCECEFCGTAQTIPQVDNEKKLNLFNRANRLRMASEFDKAASVYESIVAEFPEEAEAYWGLCLCAYGIEYVDDPVTGKKMPTCHRTRQTSIMDDSNFDMACENADAVAKKIYREEAKEIDRLQRDILRIVAGEEPYDVFICYKETDSTGGRTPDSVLAQDIYDALTGKGLKVFFARITLEDKLGQQYEPYIFAALHSAKVMLAIGTDYEYFDAVWVKNEWSRFLDMMKTDRQKTLIPCYKGIDAYDIPKEFRNLQAQDMGKLGWLQDLTRGVVKLCGKDQPMHQTVVHQPVVQQVQGGNAAALLKRGKIYLQDGDFSQAATYFDRALDEDPENAQAYEGKFLCQLRVTTLDEAMQFLIVPDSYKDLERAVRFAKGEDKKRIGAFEQAADRKYYLTQLVRGMEKYAGQVEAQEYEARCNALYREGTAEALDKMIDLYAQAIAKNLNPKVSNQSDLVVIRQQRGLVRELEKDFQLRDAVYLAKAAGMPESAARFRLNELVSKGAIEQHKTSAGTYYCALQASARRATLDQYTAAMQKMEYAWHHRQEEAAVEAAKLFERLGNYRDAAEKARECEKLRLQLKAEAKVAREKKYSQAMDALNREDYARALRLFEELGDYQDSTDRAAQCHRVIDEQLYRQAKELMENKKWSDAIKAFDTLKNYKDSREMARECRRLQEEEEKEKQRLREEAEKEIQRQSALKAQAQAAAQKRKKRNTILAVLLILLALAAFFAVTEVIIPMGHYKKAEQYLLEKEFESAVHEFSVAGKYSDADWRILETYYRQAETLMEQGQWEAASKAFKNAKDYKDASKRTLEPYYRQAEAMLAQGDEQGAIEMFKRAVTYQDAVTRYQKIYYAQGERLLAEGKEEEAICAFENAGQYSDAQERIAQCAYALAEKRLAAGDKLGALAMYVKCGNYQDSMAKKRSIVDAFTVKMDVSKQHSVGLSANGTVMAAGNNTYGQSNVDEWTDIVDICAEDTYTIGLKADGTLIVSEKLSSLYTIDKPTGDSPKNVSGWRNIVAIDTALYHTVGLKKDGTVVSAGPYRNQSWQNYGQGNVEGWTDIVAIVASDYHTVGLKKDGTVVAAGPQKGSFEDYGQCNVSTWKDVIAIAASGKMTVGLKADGTVVATDTKGSPHDWADYGQSKAENWRNIIAVAVGEEHIVGLTADGRVLAAGRNIEKQCDVTNWENIVAIAAGEYHTVGLKADGTVVAVGEKNIGSSDGRCDVDDWTDIVAIAAEGNYTMGLKADGTVLIAGKNEDGMCQTSKWNLLTADGKTVETGLAPEETEQSAKSWKGSAKGMIGLVNVEVAFDENGEILSLIVDASQETEGFGSQVEKSIFRDQFLGMKAPVNMAQVDAVSGATYSSKAVVEGINNAYLLWLQENGKAAETVPAQEDAAQPDAMAVKSWSASEDGFSGPVKVDVIFDAEGKIKSLSVAAEHETPGIGKNVEESSFRNQFIGMKAPVNIAEVDVATYATISSAASVKAINKAYELYLQSK